MKRKGWQISGRRRRSNNPTPRAFVRLTLLKRQPSHGGFRRSLTTKTLTYASGCRGAVGRFSSDHSHRRHSRYEPCVDHLRRHAVQQQKRHRCHLRRRLRHRQPPRPVDPPAHQPAQHRHALGFQLLHAAAGGTDTGERRYGPRKRNVVGRRSVECAESLVYWELEASVVANFGL